VSASAVGGSSKVADRKADADEAAEEAEATDGTALEYHAVASDNRDGELVLRRRFWEVAAAAEEGRIMTVEDILSFCFFGCDGDGNDVVKECTTVSACNTPSTSRTRKTEADDDADADEPSIVDGDCFLLVVMVTINWLSMSPPRFFVNFPLALCLFPIREFFLLLLFLLLLLYLYLMNCIVWLCFVDV